MPSLATIHGVLRRVSFGPCSEKSLHFLTAKPLEQIFLAIHGGLARTGGKRVVLAVLGDSVAADKDGFVAALQSYLSISPFVPFEVVVRNYALGATGARYTYFCNDLRGDEDVVVFENVRPGEGKSVVQLATYLKNSGFGVVLVNWRGQLGLGHPRKVYGFFEAAEALSLPLISLNEDLQHVQQCLPPDVDVSAPLEDLIYRDEIHPNRLGELILAAMIGRVLEAAVARFPPCLLKSAVRSATEVRSFSADAPVCYDKLDCTVGTADEKAAPHKCLRVIKSEGFTLQSLPNGKTWWEGTAPGHSIQILLVEPCAVIAIFRNRRPSNGMVQVSIDGVSLNETTSDLRMGVLDGSREEMWWLPNDRALLKEAVLARDLQPRPHTVQLTVLNKTATKGGTFKFDFTAISCRKA